MCITEICNPEAVEAHVLPLLLHVEFYELPAWVNTLKTRKTLHAIISSKSILHLNAPIQ